MCRADANDCPSGTDCIGASGSSLGNCRQISQPGTGTPPGTGIPLAGEGQSCGPFKIGQVEKSRGCEQGLICQNGKCARLAQ
jgi:hypothetical protein